jgi:putative copper resistance protein D
VVAVAAFVLAALAGGAVTEKVIPGLGDAGTLTRWGLPLARLIMDLCATLTVGALLMAAVLLPADGDRLRPQAISYLRAASWLAAAWSAAAAFDLILTVSDVLGEPVGQVLGGSELSSYVSQLPQGTALMLVVLLSVVVAMLTRTTATRSAALGLLAVASVALLPPPLTGHSASSPDHEVAVTGVALHVASVVPWAGGLAALTWHALAEGRAAGTGTLGVVAERFSRMALWCYVAVGVTGLANAVVRLPHPADLFTGDYGRLMLVKAGAFALLGWFGWTHRTRTLSAVAAGRPRAFARLAAAEVTLMAGTIGVAVALSRTAPPPVSGTESVAKGLLGYDLPAPLTAMRLVGLWRFDLFFGILAAVLGAAYLAGARRLRGRGESWPAGRTVWWFSGLLTMVIATMSGIATYSPVLFSVHMTQHLVLTMISPVLLVLGAPVTLALRALRPATVEGDRGPLEWLPVALHSRFVRVITHPAVATGVFVAVSSALYTGPLFEAAMRAHLGHIAMLICFLLSGGLYCWVLMGSGTLPREPSFAARALMLCAILAFHALLGVWLTHTSGMAAGWYTSLGRTWGSSLTSDLHTGGTIAWVGGEITALLMLVPIALHRFRPASQDPAPAAGRTGTDLTGLGRAAQQTGE